jgi:hypothetical protein
MFPALGVSFISLLVRKVFFCSDALAVLRGWICGGGQRREKSLTTKWGKYGSHPINLALQLMKFS